MLPRLLLISGVLLAGRFAAPAADPAPGHSVHGEAFNEGPRQAATLIPGTGGLEFPITAAHPEAQAFFTQGLGQLHGFWYYEAERSFRQVAKLDPGCAMAYWGMAMANVNNDKRARGFIARAAGLKDGASPREQLWISALAKFYQEDKRDKKQRALDIIRDLENIVHEHPRDVEAKAFLAWKIWHGREDAPMSSTQAVDALLDQVFAANPLHPAHHYRIHIWDSAGKPARALQSADVLGSCAPAIAHMWHMPGHTYSKLRRFPEAAWQQRASSCVDHAYMIRQLVLPDQIHNYAHNQEWLVRTYNELGHARSAIALAKNLVSLPRHPAFNHLDKTNSSAGYGRLRLLETLATWQLWDRLLEECRGPSLEPVTQPALEAPRLRALGVAQFYRGDLAGLDTAIRRLVALDAKSGPAPAKPAPSEGDATKKAAEAKPGKKAGAEASDKKPLPTAAALKELRALLAVLGKENDAAAKVTAAAPDIPKPRLADMWITLGQKEKALDLTKSFAPDLASLIAKASVLSALGRVEEAKKAFEQAAKAGWSMDADLPAARSMDELAKSLGLGAQWRRTPPAPADVGPRPALATLGPDYWEPPLAPAWTALTTAGAPFSSASLAGRPVVLLFYLGGACGHCVRQVEAFTKAAPDFAKAGIRLAAVTLEEPSKAGAIASQLPEQRPPPFPILCDPTLAAFKAFRAYDDSEGEPLHAAAIIDPQGHLRWLDISWQPFMDTAFVLAEARRLLHYPAEAAAE